MIALTLTQVRECIAAHLGHSVAGVGAHQRLAEDLDIDSLALHAVLLDLEEAGGVLPEPGAMAEGVTVADLHRALVAEHAQ